MFPLICDLWGRKIDFTNSKTLVSRPSRPNVNMFAVYLLSDPNRPPSLPAVQAPMHYGCPCRDPLGCPPMQKQDKAPTLICCTSIMGAFITVGPGCVGRSLNTCLFANQFGGTHGSLDMVLCRGRTSKAGRHLHGKVVTTGRGAPNTDKRLREDLYKKVMSGEAARLPCAILTKMIA